MNLVQFHTKPAELHREPGKGDMKDRAANAEGGVPLNLRARRDHRRGRRWRHWRRPVEGGQCEGQSA
eukprot:4001190-Pleurochrysis_carterae.AAC.1